MFRFTLHDPPTLPLFDAQVMAELYPGGPNVPPRPAPGTIVPGPAYTAEGSLAPSGGVQESGTRQRAGAKVQESADAAAPPAAPAQGLGVNSATLPLLALLCLVVLVALWRAA